MGNSQNKQTDFFEHWQKIDTDNGIQIYKNNITKQLAEKRFITLNQQLDIQEEIEIYKMREKNNDALVKSFCSEELQRKAESFASCAGQIGIFVLTEKMPHRLSELPQLTFPQCLLFLQQSVRAFQKIYKYYGAVSVTKQLIGLNYLGEVKCWLHQNWALNHRKHQYENLRQKKLEQLTKLQYLAYREKYLDQQEMIKTIISVIEEKCEDGKFPRPFKDEIFNQSASFKKLLLYLKDFVENFSLYNHVTIPDKINYEYIVQVKYPIRLQQQLNSTRQNTLNFINDHTHQNRQQSSINQNQTFFNFIPENKQGLSRISFKPERIKQSPAGSEIGKLMFFQPSKNYQPLGPAISNWIETPVNYQLSNKIQNKPAILFQKLQISPQVSSHSTSTSSYAFGIPSNGVNSLQSTWRNPEHMRLQTHYKSPNFQSSYSVPNTILANQNYGSKYSLNNYTNFRNKMNDNEARSVNSSLRNISANKTSLYSTEKNQNFGEIGHTNSRWQSNANKWINTNPVASSLVTESYSFNQIKPMTYGKPHYSNLQKISAFNNDDNNKNLSARITGYEGFGYSNTLVKYQQQMPSNPNFNFKIQNSIQNTQTQKQQFSKSDLTNEKKRQSSNLSGSSMSHRNSPLVQNNTTLESLANIEKLSNDVSESTLKQK